MQTIKKESKYITFVGSRKAPEPAIEKGKELVEECVKRGYIVRSGNAGGFDQVIANTNSSFREVYLPYKTFGPTIYNKNNVFIPDLEFSNYEDAKKLVLLLHPNKYLTAIQLKYLVRDVYQVLGRDLNTPSEIVYCWTEDGVDKISNITRATGGTGMAIRVASHYNIPIKNLNNRN